MCHCLKIPYFQAIQAILHRYSKYRNLSQIIIKYRADLGKKGVDKWVESFTQTLNVKFACYLKMD